MSEAQLKTFISQSHRQPVRVQMDASGPKQNLGNDGLALLPFSHISGVHTAKKKTKAGA